MLPSSWFSPVFDLQKKKNGYRDPKNVVADYCGIPQVQSHAMVSGDLGTSLPYFSDGETEVSENHGPLPMTE